jgi:hypothetical protein
MNFKRSGTALAEICLAWILLLPALAAMIAPAWAQTPPAIPTTQVTDTVYRADGTAAAGTVLISWPAFSTATGASVPAGSTSVTIGAAGALSVELAANADSNPMGSYYTVVYHLNDGSVTREYWVVPVSATPVAVSTIRSTVLPASVAMQTVSKAYVDSAIAAAVAGGSPDSLTLSGDLTANTIDVTTLNAGTVHGLFQGTVAAASLPVFGASGSAHQKGAVPDPGATSGTSRFLREDGSWTSTPGGTGSASVNTANSQLQADSVVSTAGFGIVTFGASFTQGAGCTTYATCWVNLVYNDLGNAGQLSSNIYTNNSANFGDAGATAADVSQDVFNDAPIIAASGNPILIDGGDELLNNILHLSGDTTQSAQQFKLALLTRLSIAAVDTIPAASSLCTRTGAWTADTTFANTPGQASSIAGSAISCTVAVGPSGVFYTWARSSNSIAGSYSVAIDGTVATETLSGATTQNVDNNAYFVHTYGVLGGRYTASPGYHTITFTNVSGTTVLYAFAVPPSLRYRGVSGPKVYTAGAPPNSIPIVGWSIAGNVATFTTGQQALTTGQSVTLAGFSASTFFNGQTVTVTALNSTTFTAAFTHANGSGTEFGAAIANAGPVASYNAAALQIAQILARDGLNVSFVDTNSVLDPALDFSFGPVQNWPASTASEHVSNRGHAHQAQMMEAVINAAPQWPNASATNLAVSNTASATNLLVGSATVAQNNSAVFYDGNGDGNYFAFLAANGDSNLHLFAQSGPVGGSVYVQGNMGWVFTSPTPLFGTGLKAQSYQTNGNCNASASPATCYSAAAGSVAIPASAAALTVNTNAVTASSEIFLQWDASLGAALGVTCSTAAGTLSVSSRVAGTSFSIASTDASDPHPQCVSYHIIN